MLRSHWSIAVLLVLAGSVAADAASQDNVVLESGDWTLIRAEDRLTREPTFTLQGHPTEIDGSASADVVLSFSGEHGASQFSITHDLPGELEQVTWRVGDGSVRRALYASKGDGHVVVEDDQFLKDLVDAEGQAEIVIRITSAGTETTLVFSADGFGEAYTAFLEETPAAAPDDPSVFERCGPLVRASIAADTWSEEFLASDCMAELGPSGLATLLTPSPQQSAPSPERNRSPSQSDRPVTVTRADARFTEQNDSWWRWAYQVTLVNNSNERIDLGRICIKAADADGFTIDSDTERISLRPNESRDLSGYVLIDASVAPNVERIAVGQC